MLSQIAALQRLSVADLQGEWLRLYGEPTRSRNKQFLFRRLAWRAQELANGGLSDRTEQRIAELSSDDFVRGRTPTDSLAAPSPQPTLRPRRDARLPTSGTVLVREYRGRQLRLVVHEDHFELDGHSFRSLSEAARHVTGSRWNGRLFWGLTKRKRKS